MKKIAFTLLSVMLLAVAAINASAQESRTVSDFNAIASAGPFKVHIKLDGTESVKVDAEANIVNEIETIVEDHTLKIRFKHREHDYDRDEIHKADIYVTAKSLNALYNAGSGSMNVEGVCSANNFKAYLSGSGSINAAVKSDGLRVNISGSGSIKISGSSRDAEVAIAGSGNLEGKELKTESAKISIAGSGNAYLAVDKSITAHIAGSGNVVYSGNASIENSRSAGSGRVSKAD
jgi:hypothetical protein